MLMTIAKDGMASEDTRAHAADVLKRAQRGRDSDASFVGKLDAKPEQKAQKTQQNIADVMKSINGDLDNFLAMVEDDSEEEVQETAEKPVPKQVESLVPDFVCALCKCGPSTEIDMYPCLIAHFDENSALRTSAVRRSP